MLTKKEYSIRCVFLVIIAASAWVVAQDRPFVNAKESDLIAVLQSDAAKSEKAITCKQLAVFGTEKSVPVLAPLLEDEELASWARIALEAIPGDAADAALRDALGKVKGRLLIGVINSIGVRRDADAVDALVKKLDNDNAGVASAAAIALGHIGGGQATEALTQSLADTPVDIRSAVAEGCILCAEWFVAHNRTNEAVKLYDTVRQADVPNQRRLEAIRGAILARGSAGIPLLIEQLQSADKDRLSIGLRTARELPGRNVTEALASELTRLSPERRPMLLLALADRKDSSVLPTVHGAAQSGPKNLRITAIEILIRLGDVTCVPILLEAVTEGDVELERAAMETLIRLAGKDVDADLTQRLPQARGRLRQVLIELAGQRQIGEALPVVVTSLNDVDGGVRGAAIETVGIIGKEQQTADLVKLLEKTDSSEERTDIRKSLLSISGRCGEKCIPYVRVLTRSSDNELYMIGLRALAIIGGPEALATIKSAIENTESQVQDEAVRILSTWPNNWPEDDEAGKALLVLATSTEKMSHQVLGLRGYLQYIRGSKKFSNEQKVARVIDMRPLIKRTEEKQQAIAVLGDAPGRSALELLMRFAEDSTVTEEAYSAMVQVVSRDIDGVSNDQRREVLTMVTEKSKNNNTRLRARRTLREIQ
ncbi:MAG: HEAT repeat domain-containing protein [Sedimentisphaerales bacterium]|nr:HEAT repeat domain-containing protein [Sedimentisphaerales bacterium]